ncbi:hypothetical protein SLA2020_099110 [Shorea laevis]
MEILSYAHGSTEIFGLQIDAAINSGNSGGPAFNDKGKCVGISFQSLKHEDVENIGYVITTSVIIHFIQDYEKNGIYTGFPILGVEWQNMENPDFRVAMGRKSDQKGIANDGTVPFWHGECMVFSYLVSQKYTRDTAVVKVLRNSKILEFNIKLSTHKRLIPVHTNGKPPSYYIIAGFVFTAVTVPYLCSECFQHLLSEVVGFCWSLAFEFSDFGLVFSMLRITSLTLQSNYWISIYMVHAMAESIDEQLLLVSQVLVADINIGFEEIVNIQVLAFNGKKNLKSLADMVENCDDEYLKFDLEYQQMVLLQTKTARAATSDIITTHCISSAISNDLKT